MSELKYPDGLKYTVEHVWFKDNGDGTAIVGISDYAQDQLGEVAFVDLPSVGKSFEGGKSFGTVESIKSVNELYMPVTASVVEVNGALADEPTLVNTGPYAEGWMIKIRMAESASRELLVSAAEYQAGL